MASGPKTPRKYNVLARKRKLAQMTKLQDEAVDIPALPKHQAVLPRCPMSPHHNAERYALTTLISPVVLRTKILMNANMR
jgi:hypothetical protein